MSIKKIEFSFGKSVKSRMKTPFQALFKMPCNPKNFDYQNTTNISEKSLLWNSYGGIKWS